MQYWYQQQFLKIQDHSREHIIPLLALAARLKAAKKGNRESPVYLQGKNIALIFEKSGTRTRCAFEVAAADQGGSTSYISTRTSQLGRQESLVDTAIALGRIYDGIAYRGSHQYTLETLARHTGIPVYNALTDSAHPTQMLADLLTIREHTDKPFEEIQLAYLGDGQNSTAISLLFTAAIMGINIRIAAPASLQPDPETFRQAEKIAQQTGAKITITEKIAAAVQYCDFLYTDAWVSMEESDEIWEQRIPLLMPYRIDQDTLIACQNPDVKFMHCLPAFHDRTTPAGDRFFTIYKKAGIEVSHNAFMGKNSIVFDQVENRMHTIKALLVATLNEYL